MNSTIKYSGQVAVKVKNKPVKKIKNTGTDDLFNLLCSMLAGNKRNLPTGIDLRIMVDDTTEQTVLVRPAAISSRELDKEKCSVIFEATLNHSNFTVKDPLTSCSVVLVSLNDLREKDYLDLARIVVDNSNENRAILEAISTVIEHQNGQATVSWTMNFSNNEEDK